MSAMVLVLLIGLFNLAMGYALAVRLGYGPPSLLEAWDALSPPPVELPAPPAAPLHPDSVPAAEPPEPPPTPEPEGQAAGDSDAADIEQLAAVPLEEMLDGVGDQADAVGGEGNAGPAMPAPENWDPDEPAIEMSLTALGVAMMKSGAKCMELDNRLRTPGQRDNLEVLRQTIDELRDDCQVYLEQSNTVSERISRRVTELNGPGWLADEIEIAALEQAAQIETTLSNLDQIAKETDVETIRNRLLAEIRRLRVARHKLREDQEIAYAAIARHEGRLEQVTDPHLTRDPLTELPNRIGLEAVMCGWWRQQYHQTRQIGAILLAVDALGALNENHGPAVSDRVLQHLARLLEKHVAEGDLLGRYGGGRFLILTLGAGPRATATKAERLRQVIEKTSFLHGDDEIRVTVSGAVAEVKADDAEDALLARLTETLQRARQEGGNTSYLYGNAEIERIEAPNLGAEPIEITI